MDEHEASFPKSGVPKGFSFGNFSVANRMLILLWGAVMAFALIVNLLRASFPRIQHYCFEMATLLPHPVLMLIGWIGLLLLFLIIRKIWKDSKALTASGIANHYPIAIVAVCFFFLQLYLVYNYYFETDWDVQVLLGTARNIANHGNINEYCWYYSNYPNNLLLTWFFAAILFITKPLHLGIYDFFAIIVVQSAFCVLTFLMLYQLCIKLWKRYDLAYFACCIYLILIGLSPWVSIPYSDSWALLFPVLLLELRYCLDWKGKLSRKWFWITFVAYLGFRIKPQVFFAFMAIVLVDGFMLWRLQRQKQSVKPFVIRYLIPALCGFLVSASVSFVLVKSTRVHRDTTQTIGAAHYLMLGMNQNTIGHYCDEDLMFSRSFETPSARFAGNMKEVGRRVREMGTGGFGKLMCEKMLANYQDGTFAWGKEGWFYKTVFPEKNRHLSPFMRNLYYNRQMQGAYYPWWCSFATAIWLGVLLFAFLATFGRWNNPLKVIAISIIILTLYELLFEARARYLYAYVPFYIVMAVQGAETMVERLSNWRRKKMADGKR